MANNENVAVDSIRYSENEAPIIPSNVNAADIDSETRDKLRGDAIGDTLYSESFVVKTLMQLSNFVQWNEKLEEELCFLWDMTLEKDVCNFMLELSYPSIACVIIIKNDEARLIEIVIGILANICCICNDINVLTEAEIETVLSILLSDDPLILIQVVRMIKAISYNKERLSFITESVLEQLNFILTNSTNNELIVNALDALSKITVYDKVEVSLLKGDFIKSSCIAYQTVCKDTEKFVNLTVFTHFIQIVNNICTYINESTDNCDLELWGNVNENILDFLAALRSFFTFYTHEGNLLPLEEELVYIVDASASIFQILNIKFCSNLFKSMITITSLLIKANCKDIDTFIEIVCYFVSVGDIDEIKNILLELERTNTCRILNNIKCSAAEYHFNYKKNFISLCNDYLEE